MNPLKGFGLNTLDYYLLDCIATLHECQGSRRSDRMEDYEVVEILFIKWILI